MSGGGGSVAAKDLQVAVDRAQTAEAELRDSEGGRAGLTVTDRAAVVQSLLPWA